MLDKIILSRDRHSATVHFDTHSFGLYSDEDVVTLVTELILNPYEKSLEIERVILEDTIETDLQLCLFTRDVA